MESHPPKQPDEPRELQGPARPRGVRWAPWLLPPLALTAVTVGAAVVRSGPGWIFGATVGLLLLVPIVWVAVSALWPASADRRCPKCAKGSLERLHGDSTVGVRCRRCGHRDPTASAWLLAEEEGPLEELVLSERRRRSAERGAGARSKMDSLIRGR